MALLRDQLTMIAALGAGIVVGVSGIYMYYKLNRTMTQEISQLSGTIETLKLEIEELKKTGTSSVSYSRSSKSKSERKLQAKKASPNLTAAVDGLGPSTSFDSSAEDNDEFFDFSDSEDAVSESHVTINGPQSLGSSYTSATSINTLDELDRLLDGSSEMKQTAYLCLRDKSFEFEEESNYLWRLAKATHFAKLCAQKDGHESLKKELCFAAYDAASKALKLTKRDPEVHKWYAITLGALGEYVTVQEKVKNGYTFKEHVETAVQLKPLDPTLHHLLGRWCFEVSMLSWLERKAAALLFSDPPTATLDEAREHLLEADRLLPNWKENVLLISKCCISDGDYATAIEWIDKALNMPSNAEDDELAHTELETLQLKYRSYRN